MLAGKEPPRTKRTTREAYFDRCITPCPAELLAPATYRPADPARPVLRSP
jgi:hypothetical protein